MSDFVFVKVFVQGALVLDFMPVEPQSGQLIKDIPSCASYRPVASDSPAFAEVMSFLGKELGQASAHLHVARLVVHCRIEGLDLSAIKVKLQEHLDGANLAQKVVVHS